MEGEEEDGFCFHEVKFVDKDGRPRTSRVPVVQELVRRGLTCLPEMFIRSESSCNQAQCYDGGLETLQTVDMAKLRSGSTEELEKLAKGAEEQGMFLIEEHGMDHDLLNEVKDVLKGFFALSYEEKRKCVGSHSSADNMGYGRNFVKSEDQSLDWIDRLTAKALPKGVTDGLHVWPQNPPHFRRVIETYVDEARKVLDRLLESLAESFSLEKQAFLRQFDPDTSEMKVRINCYPPCPRPDLTLGLVPHTDPSALTLLAQFDAGGTGGLQVLSGPGLVGGWRTVEWPTGTLLVNAGDLLEIMSDGRVKSPWHRVKTQSDVERISIALFYNPPPEAEIVPVSGGGNNGGSFRKVSVADFCNHFYSISPTMQKEAILYAKHEIK